MEVCDLKPITAGNKLTGVWPAGPDTAGGGCAAQRGDREHYAAQTRRHAAGESTETGTVTPVLEARFQCRLASAHHYVSLVMGMEAAGLSLVSAPWAQVFSFKLRGAYNKMASLTPEQRAKGVICSSAGNHAQGVALAAGHLVRPSCPGPSGPSSGKRAIFSLAGAST